MKIYALVGESGSGKSHRALMVAGQHEIDYIIDDGLLIKGNKKLAGRSAKREGTYIAAVKRAIFHYEDHKLEVKHAIAKECPNKILVLGTSDEMIVKITNRLGIGRVEKTIYIRDVATEKDISLAKNIRLKTGKHVVPVPAVELKVDFSGYFLDKLKLFNFGVGKRNQIVEKSLVRPTFSYLGKYTVSNRALAQIIQRTLSYHDVIREVQRIRFHNEEQGIKVEVDVTTKIGVNLQYDIRRAMQSIHEYLEEMTQLHVISLKINIKSASL